MGTSINQGSPRNSSNWKPIFAYYVNPDIPEEGVIKEVWRASEKESIPISKEIKSDLLYECYKAVNSSGNFQEAIQKFNNAVTSTKQNSIVAEFAKRVIPVSFQSENPSQQWKQNLFSEFTKYVVSRDASGFVGENYRNKSVSELIDFKSRLGGKVAEIVSSETQQINSKKDWNSFVDSSISKLKSLK